MTSKEALERLLVLARACDYEVREHRNSYCDMLEKAIQKDLERLEKLEKVIEILKRICLFEFEEETTYPQDEWADCYVIYITQFNNGFNKEEYELLKEVLKNKRIK